MNKQGSKLSLRFKISAVVSILLVVSCVVIVLVVNRLVKDSMVASKVDTIGDLLNEQTHETSAQLDEVKIANAAAAKLPEVLTYLSSTNPKQQDPKILETLTKFSLGRNIASLYIINNKGVAMVSTDPTFVGSNFSFRNYVKKALDGQSFSEMAIGSVSKKLGFYFSSPIVKSDGTIIGVMAAKLDPGAVITSLETSELAKSGSLMFANADGVIVHSTREDFVYRSLGQLSKESQSEIVNEKRYPSLDISALDYDVAMNYVLSGETGSKVFLLQDEMDEQEEYVAVKRIAGYPYALILETGQKDILAAIAGIDVVIIQVIITSWCILVLALLFFLRWALQPLEKLEKYALNVSEGKMDEDIIINSGDELESLSKSIKGMVGSIKSSYVDLEEEVKKKTAEIADTLAQFEAKNIDLESTKKAILNVMEDLNTEKEKIGDEKNRIETILRSIGDGVFVTDALGEIVMVNQAAEKMTGYSNMEMFGKKYSEVFKFVNEDDPESDYPDFVMEAIATGKVGSLLPHTVMVAKNGSTVPVLDSAAPLRTFDGVVFGCVVVVRDNTQERELEKNKDDFLSVTSHQLRTPLGSMRWNLEMLLGGDVGVLGEEALDIAKQIYDGNIRMIGLVNDLLNVSRIDQGRVMDDPIDTDLGEVITDTIKEIEPLAKERQVNIISNISEGEGNLKIDKNRLREVLENLMSNAVKYNKVGGEVHVDLTSEGESVSISILDTGMGIPKNDLNRLFSKFFRAENAVHSETEGTGLGLYVVKKFVEGWGGKMDVQSEEGKGSRFIISLPKNIKSEVKET